MAENLKSTPQTPKIFISYRRDDHKILAASLAAHLRWKFGRQSVFFDRKSIFAGQKFDKRIEDAAKASDIMFALIGPNWNLIKNGEPRLNDPNDWVRREIEIGLQVEERVIAVYADIARPERFDPPLPEELSAIDKYQDIEIHGDHLDRDFEAIVDQLAGRGWEPSGADGPPRGWPQAATFGAVLCSVLLLALIWLTMIGWIASPFHTASDSSEGENRIPSVLIDNPISASDREAVEGATEATILRVAVGCQSRRIRELAEIYENDPKTLLQKAMEEISQ